MFIQIISVNMKYQDKKLESVQIHFSGNNDNHSFSMSGYIPLSADDYASNMSVQEIETLIRQQLLNEIGGTVAPEDPPIED